MRRREFITLLGAAASAWTHSVMAQGAQKARRVGVMIGYDEGDEEALLRLATLRSGLRGLGWQEGAVTFDIRLSGNTPKRLMSDAQDLVKRAPDVIVVQGNRPFTIMRQVTRSIPIVFAQVADPVGSKLIDNLARPGGNATGFTHFEVSMGGKWLEALKDMVPSLERVLVLYHPDTAVNVAFWKAAEAAASIIGVTTIPGGVQDSAAIERLLAANMSAGLVVMPHDITSSNRDLIVTLAAKLRMPAVYPYRFFFTQGGLAYYSFNYVEQWRQVATYVDRILRGEKPADLPVQAPTKFELTINLKTAKALDLVVPPTVLARADEVIE